MIKTIILSTILNWLPIHHYDITIKYKDHLYMERKVVIANVWSFYEPKVYWDWDPITDVESISCRYGFKKHTILKGHRLLLTGATIKQRK